MGYERFPPSPPSLTGTLFSSSLFGSRSLRKEIRGRRRKSFLAREKKFDVLADSFSHHALFPPLPHLKKKTPENFSSFSYRTPSSCTSLTHHQRRRRRNIGHFSTREKKSLHASPLPISCELPNSFSQHHISRIYFFPFSTLCLI